MGPTTADIQTIVQGLVDELTGTCDSQPAWVADHPQELEILDALGEEIFCCPVCGWWCGTDELNTPEDGEDERCDQCAEETGFAS